MAVILLSYKFNLNPDNLATPLAASIGDVVSLTMLSFIASILYQNLGKKSRPFFRFTWTINLQTFFYLLVCSYTQLVAVYDHFHILHPATVVDYLRFVQ